MCPCLHPFRVPSGHVLRHFNMWSGAPVSKTNGQGKPSSQRPRSSGHECDRLDHHQHIQRYRPDTELRFPVSRQALGEYIGRGWICFLEHIDMYIYVYIYICRDFLFNVKVSKTTPRSTIKRISAKLMSTIPTSTGCARHPEMCLLWKFSSFGIAWSTVLLDLLGQCLCVAVLPTNHNIEPNFGKQRTHTSMFCAREKRVAL